jgi:hypothetical protein
MPDQYDERARAWFRAAGMQYYIAGSSHAESFAALLRAVAAEARVEQRAELARDFESAGLMAIAAMTRAWKEG